MNKEAELKNMRFVKTVLMFIIILHHCLGNQPLSTAAYPYIIRWAPSFANYAFVLASGYIFAFTKARGEKYNDFKQFALTKAKRLLVPFVFVSAVWAVWVKYVFRKRDILALIKAWALGTDPDQLWFVLMLFEVMAVFWLLQKKFGFECFKIKWLIVFAVVFYIGLLGKIFLCNYFRIFDTMKMLLFFYIGYELWCDDGFFFRKIPFWAYLIMYFAFFVTEMVISALNTGDGFAKIVLIGVGDGLEILTNISGATAALFTLLKIAEKVDWQKSRAFAFFEKRAMPIYLFHQQAIYIIVFFLPSEMNAFAITLISFIGATAVSAIISSILFAFPLTTKLLGGKSSDNFGGKYVKALVDRD